MDSRFYHLYGGIIPNIHRRVRRQRHLRQTERSGVWVPRGPDNLEYWHHRVRHVWWSAVGPVGPKPEVHVEKGCGMPLEPAGLYSDSSSSYGPFGSVGGCGHAAAWEGRVSDC